MNDLPSLEFNPLSRILFKYYYGLISVEDIKNSWTDAIAKKQIPDNVRGFVLDYRKAHFDFEPRRLTEIAEFYMANIHVFGNKYIAMVADNPKDIVYPILFQAEDKGCVTKPFSTMEAAVAWVLASS